MLGFKNVKAYIEGKGIIKTDIAIKDGKIFAIGNNLDIDEIIKRLSFTISEGINIALKSSH